jgi:hypothetical protein
LQALPQGIDPPTTRSTAPPDKRRIRRELVLSCFVAGVSPFLIFVLLRPSFAELPCLLAAALPPALLEAALYARYRQLNPLCTISLAALALTALCAALGDSMRLLLAKESLVTGVLGAGFLYSLSSRRPAYYYLTRQFLLGDSPARAALYDFAWKAVPQMRIALLNSTLVWGLAYFGELLLVAVLVYSAPHELALLVGRILFYTTTVGLVGWTASRMRRVRRRIEAAMRSSDRSAYGVHPG